MPRSINFWKAFVDHPPALIRLLARRRKGRTVTAITSEEIAIASGIPLARVHAISQSTDWGDITITEAERFCAGCNFDPTNGRDRNRERAYSAKCKTTRPRFQWIQKHPRFASEFRPLIVLLQRAALKSSSPQASSPVSLTSPFLTKN